MENCVSIGKRGRERRKPERCLHVSRTHHEIHTNQILGSSEGSMKTARGPKSAHSRLLDLISRIKIKRDKICLHFPRLIITVLFFSIY